MPIACHLLPGAYLQVSLDLLIQLGQLSLSVLQTGARLVVTLPPPLKVGLLQVSVSHHQGPQTFPGKLLEKTAGSESQATPRGPVTRPVPRGWELLPHIQPVAREDTDQEHLWVQTCRAKLQEFEPGPVRRLCQRGCLGA